jgi:hypothetical protein
MENRILFISIKTTVKLNRIESMKLLQSVFLLVLFLFSCTPKTKFERQVLSEFPVFSPERKAARHILDNMRAHEAFDGKAIDRYRAEVLAYDSLYSNQDPTVMDSIWQTVSAGVPTPQAVPHSEQLDPDFITRHIRTVFGQWDRCAWKDSIDFDVFCEYILPYSVKDEPLIAWRGVLHDKYYPLIEGVSSPKEAFDTIYNHIYTRFEQEDAPFAFTTSFMPDPLLTDKLMRGTCDIRTLFVVAVARSLCIPAAYDFVKSFANFSNRGHSWPVYVGTNGKKAYVFSIYDTVSHDRGIIDATLFRLRKPFDDGPTAYKIDSLKKIAKIFRHTFAANPQESSGSGNRQTDVSANYGFNDRIELIADRKIDGRVYLCTFLTGDDWVPIHGQIVSGRKIRFDALGRDVTYLLAGSDGEELVPLANPVTLHRDGSQHHWDPDPSKTETVVLRRKYMLRTTWADRGQEVIRTTFEVSDTEDFRENQLLHTVQSPPLGVESVEIADPHPIRYVRTKVPPGTWTGLAELAFFGRDKAGHEIELRGKSIHANYLPEEAAKAIDRDFLTIPYTRTLDGWIGYDFGPGQAPAITRIEYCPWNDGNMIERGDRYELLYYDMGWHSLGQKTADSLALVYDNVPSNAILWLRDLTKGQEERIFTYADGKQIWW